MRRFARWFEELTDPYADADGPPPRSFGAFLRWLMAGAWGPVWLLGIVSLLLGAAEAAAAWIVGWLVDETAASADPAAYLGDNWPALAGAAAFFILARPVLMIAATGLVSLTVGPGIYHLSVWRLHRHTLGQSMGFFEDDFAGRIAQKQTQTSDAVSNALAEFMNAIAYGIATLIGAAVLLTAVDWRLALVLAVWFAVYAWIVLHFLPRIRRRSRARAEAAAALSGQLVDSFTNIQTVKLFAHAGREVEAARGALGRFREAALARGRIVWGFRSLLGALSGLLPATMIGLALWLWSAGHAGPGLIAMAGLISTRLAQMSGWISFTAMGIFANIGTAEDGMRTLSPPHGLVDRPGARDPGRVEGRIRFEDVTYQYGREEGGGLDRFSLEIAPGEKVALVGRSGAGKSTALALLLRLRDVEDGRITLDGTDIRDLTQDGLRRAVAMVTQDTAMFNRSALDNILYGRPEAGEAAAIEAAKQADADHFIRDLRDIRGREGYAAHLGERGVKLSGGQRQRIALARAILKDAPILALDEATSALDSETEAAVQAALARLMRGKTVIAIAHRLSTIAAMDRIIVMEAGRVAEQGSHAELLEAGGLYAGFWERQSGGFIASDPADAESQAAE